MERQLRAAADGGAVHEGERRDVHLAEAAEHRMTELTELLDDLLILDEADGGEIGTDGEDERLSGDGDRGELRHGGNLVESGIEGRETARAEACSAECGRGRCRW